LIYHCLLYRTETPLFPAKEKDRLRGPRNLTGELVSAYLNCKNMGNLCGSGEAPEMQEEERQQEWGDEPEDEDTIAAYYQPFVDSTNNGTVLNLDISQKTDLGTPRDGRGKTAVLLRDEIQERDNWRTTKQLLADHYVQTPKLKVRWSQTNFFPASSCCTRAPPGRKACFAAKRFI
jgi:hypothetical protein